MSSYGFAFFWCFLIHCGGHTSHGMKIITMEASHLRIEINYDNSLRASCILLRTSRFSKQIVYENIWNFDHVTVTVVLGVGIASTERHTLTKWALRWRTFCGEYRSTSPRCFGRSWRTGPRWKWAAGRTLVAVTPEPCGPRGSRAGRRGATLPRTSPLG